MSEKTHIQTLQVFESINDGMFCADNFFVGASGNIPTEIANCKKLGLLDVSHNSLTGEIPLEIESIPDLYFLNLAHNQLSGPIPSQFANLQTLSVFDFSYNNLSGPIPLFDSYNVSVFEGNPLLCGALLSRTCPNTEPTLRHHSKQQNDPILRAWLVGALFAAASIVLLVGMCCFFCKYRLHIFKYFHRESIKRPWKLTAFQRLDFSADEVYTLHDIVQQSLSCIILPMGIIFPVRSL